MPRLREPDPVWLDREPPSTHAAFGGFTFLLRGDTLADVRFDGTLLVRAVRFVVRDQDWSTVPAEVVSVSPITTDAGVTEFALRVHNAAGDIAFDWTATVTVDATTLRFDVRGQAASAFRRNRIGIVVLHPPLVAGERLLVRHRDAPPTATSFPAEIAAHQPARDVAGYDWSSDGVEARLDFDGDVFEMEDQRNWTDASFKTYSTPLSLPFPVDVAPGDVVRQGVALTARRTAGAVAATEAGIIRNLSALPAIAVGASTAPDPQGDRPEWLRGTAVLVELEAASPNWRAALDRAGVEAGSDPLDVRIVVSTPQQLGAVLDAVATLRLARLGVFHARSHTSEPELWEALVAGAAQRGIVAQLVGGVRSHFTELNRNRDRLPDGIPALAFSITPQMHDLERAQVVESLPLQRAVALQAVRHSGGRVVHVGPVTLRSRFNAVSTSPRPVAATADLATGYGAQLVDGATDPRQLGHGYAAWLVASAASLAVPGVGSIAVAESVGPRGFADAAGRRYPASHAVEWLVGVAGWASPDGDPVTAVTGTAYAVAGRRGDRVVVVLANPHERAAVVAVDALAPGTVERLAPGSPAPVAGEWSTTIVLAPGEVLRLATTA